MTNPSTNEQTYREMLAKLTANISFMDAKIKADPLPVLQKATDQMNKLHTVLLEIETALNDTNWVYDDAIDANIPPMCYLADHDRIMKARNILSKWMAGQ